MKILILVDFECVQIADADWSFEHVRGVFLVTENFR